MFDFVMRNLPCLAILFCVGVAAIGVMLKRHSTRSQPPMRIEALVAAQWWAQQVSAISLGQLERKITLFQINLASLINAKLTELLKYNPDGILTLSVVHEPDEVLRTAAASADIKSIDFLVPKSSCMRVQAGSVSISSVYQQDWIKLPLDPGI